MCKVFLSFFRVAHSVTSYIYAQFKVLLIDFEVGPTMLVSSLFVCSTEPVTELLLLGQGWISLLVQDVIVCNAPKALVDYCSHIYQVPTLLHLVEIQFGDLVRVFLGLF